MANKYMSFLDTFRKSRQEKQDKDNIEKKNQATLPPEGHTLKEILADKEHSDLFGKLLVENGRQDLADRIASGTLEESDIAFLAEQRKIFSERITQAEKVEEFITEDNIVSIARNNPSFREIVGLSGKEAAVKVIQNQLKELAITDEDRFKKLAKKIEGYESYKKNGEYKELNNKVEELLRKNNISSKEYSDALALEDPEKGEALEKLAKKYGRRWFGGLNQNLLDDLGQSGDSVEKQLALLSTKEKSIGAILSSAISENESVRKSLFAELTGEKTTETQKSGFAEAKKGTFDEAKFNKNWEHEKEQSDYDNQPANVQDNIKDIFTREQKEAYREESKSKGFWASIFTAILERMIDDKKAKLN